MECPLSSALGSAIEKGLTLFYFVFVPEKDNKNFV